MALIYLFFQNGTFGTYLSFFIAPTPTAPNRYFTTFLAGIGILDFFSSFF